jgi:hypothetical protein
LLFREAVKTGILPGLRAVSARPVHDLQVFAQIGIAIVVAGLQQNGRLHRRFC